MEDKEILKHLTTYEKRLVEILIPKLLTVTPAKLRQVFYEIHKYYLPERMFREYLDGRKVKNG